MCEDVINKRYTIKAFSQVGDRPVELAHPENMKAHPWSYMELPFDPEYSLYNNRMTPEYLNHLTADEQYWSVRQGVVLRNTGEFPVQISGPDTSKFANYIFTRDVTKTEPGRCSYQFACYYDGGMITDGVMLHLKKDKLWMAQADGEIFNWYLAHANNFNVEISDPKVWVSQIQGPKSMDLLRDLLGGILPAKWTYFDIAEVKIDKEVVIVSRTGFSNELGWEIYLTANNNIELIGEKLLEVGKKYDLKITGTPVFRARRIEAGLLSAGCDFDKTTTPFEVGLDRFIDMEKGDFIGKDALLNSVKLNKLWGVRVREGIAKKGRTILKGGKNIGFVTSSTWSPYQECGVAMARIDKNVTVRAGSEVEVLGVDGNNYLAQICSLPMYDKKGEIVRGIKQSPPTGPNPWLG